MDSEIENNIERLRQEAEYNLLVLVNEHLHKSEYKIIGHDDDCIFSLGLKEADFYMAREDSRQGKELTYRVAAGFIVDDNYISIDSYKIDRKAEGNLLYADFGLKNITSPISDINVKRYIKSISDYTFGQDNKKPFYLYQDHAAYITKIEKGLWDVFCSMFKG